MANHPATRNILPVVLAGGAGTRLWPLSRANYPKQFLRLFEESSALQQTLLRLSNLRCRAPYVVCNREHRFIAADQCRQCGVDPDALVVEPAGRNTAPAAALAAFRATSEGADPVLFVLPADHHIADEAAFVATVGRAIGFAETGNIVVFGIRPTYPATAYGYIQGGATASDDGVAEVAAFVEKPAGAVAKRYLADGGWYWNSGMFLFRASVYLDELGHHRPDLLDACKDAATAEQADVRFHLAGDALLRCRPESIDRAVMEENGSWHRGPDRYGLVRHRQLGLAHRGTSLGRGPRSSLGPRRDRAVWRRFRTTTPDDCAGQDTHPDDARTPVNLLGRRSRSRGSRPGSGTARIGSGSVDSDNPRCATQSDQRRSRCVGGHRGADAKSCLGGHHRARR